jgi:hypothetical protein
MKYKHILMCLDINISVSTADKYFLNLYLPGFSLFLDVYQRITISQILEHPWFKRGYKPPVFDEKYQTSLDDVDAAFGDSEASQMDQQIFSLLW